MGGRGFEMSGRISYLTAQPLSGAHRYLSDLFLHMARSHAWRSIALGTASYGVVVRILDAGVVAGTSIEVVVIPVACRM